MDDLGQVMLVHIHNREVLDEFAHGVIHDLTGKFDVGQPAVSTLPSRVVTFFELPRQQLCAFAPSRLCATISAHGT
jgi:hypothetical protein